VIRPAVHRAGGVRLLLLILSWVGYGGPHCCLRPEEDDLNSNEFDEPTVGEIFDNDQRVLGAEALKRDTIVKVGTVAWADLELASPMTLNEKATPVSTTDVRGAMDEES